MIQIDETVQPVQHAPRRIAFVLRPKLKEALDDLVAQDIIAPVTTPTEWISSIVAVPNKNGKLRICLHPKVLDHAIQKGEIPAPNDRGH